MWWPRTVAMRLCFSTTLVAPENRFLNFRLAGTRSNRDGMGARIRVVAGGISQIREIEVGGSYLSQSDLRANFGLGKAARADTVEVSWPSGRQQSFKNVEADKFYLIEEGSDQIALQSFVRRQAGPLALACPWAREPLQPSRVACLMKSDQSMARM
jgi:hypothetical protein